MQLGRQVMRPYSWFVTVLVVGVFGLVAVAAEKPPDNYKKAMQDLNAFATGIDKAVMDENYDNVASLGRSAREAFGVVEKYWTGKSTDAAELAQKGGKAAADLVVMAGIKSQEGAVFSAKEARDGCMTCHAAHREQMADGTFQIK
jgi:hypothetical protein